MLKTSFRYQSAVSNDYSVLDSSQFANEVANMEISDDEVMVSVEPQKNRPASLSGEQVNRRDATKPALRYAPQLHRIVGLEDPPISHLTK